MQDLDRHDRWRSRLHQLDYINSITSRGQRKLAIVDVLTPSDHRTPFSVASQKKNESIKTQTNKMNTNTWKSINSQLLGFSGIFILSGSSFFRPKWPLPEIPWDFLGFKFHLFRNTLINLLIYFEINKLIYLFISIIWHKLNYFLFWPCIYVYL